MQYRRASWQISRALSLLYGFAIYFLDRNLNMPSLVLASTSPVRKQLLERLRIPFITVAPEIDETPLPGEKAQQLVARLAEAKARAVSQQFPNSLIIACDEVGDFKGTIIGKP